MAKFNCRVTTPVFTASFPHLFKPQGSDGYAPTYSVNMVFDPSEDLSKLEQAIEQAIEKGIADPNKFAGSRPKKLELPLRQGDDVTDKTGKPRPEFAGRVYAVARAKEDSPPSVVDLQLDRILDEKEIYGGVKLRAAVVAYPWKRGGKCGVSLYLDKVQKIDDGEAFGAGSTSDEEDFGN